MGNERKHTQAIDAPRTWSAGRSAIAATCVLLLLGLVALLPLLAKTQPDRTEIVLVARDMGFYLNGQGERNPTIRVKPGAEIRLVLRNEDPGIQHDFVVAPLGWIVPVINDRGERAVNLRAPDRPGSYEYTCTPHAVMMHGILEVTDPAE